MKLFFDPDLLIEESDDGKVWIYSSGNHKWLKGNSAVKILVKTIAQNSGIVDFEKIEIPNRESKIPGYTCLCGLCSGSGGEPTHSLKAFKKVGSTLLILSESLKKRHNILMLYLENRFKKSKNKKKE